MGNLFGVSGAQKLVSEAGTVVNCKVFIGITDSNNTRYECGFEPTHIICYNKRTSSGISAEIYFKDLINEGLTFHTALGVVQNTITVDKTGFNRKWPQGSDKGMPGYAIAIRII